MKRPRTKKSPARERYERNHPTVSFRVSKELYDRLQVAKEKEGRSYTDIMEAGLGLFEVKIKAKDDIKREAYDEGWEKGVEQACELFEVPYPCSRCGMEMVVDTDAEKKAIRKFMQEQGWGHGQCPNR